MSAKKYPELREKPAMVLKGHTGYVKALVSLEKGFFASGSFDKTVRIWKTSDGTPIDTIDVPNSVECLCYLGNNLLAIGVQDSHHVIILDVDRKTSTVINHATPNRPSDTVHSISLTGQPDHIAIICTQGDHSMVRILNVQTGAILFTSIVTFGSETSICRVKPNSLVFSQPQTKNGFGLITHQANRYRRPKYIGSTGSTIITPFDTEYALVWWDEGVWDNPRDVNQIELTHVKTGKRTLFCSIMDKDVYVIDMCTLGNQYVAVSTNLGIYIVKIKGKDEHATGEIVAHYYTPIELGGTLCDLKGGGLAMTLDNDIVIYKTRYENTTRRQALRSILSRTNPNVAGHILSFLEGNSIKTKKKRPVYKPPAPHNSSGELDYVAGAKRFAERVSKPLRIIEEEQSLHNNATGNEVVVPRIVGINLDLNRSGRPIHRTKHVQRHTAKQIRNISRKSQKRLANFKQSVANRMRLQNEGTVNKPQGSRSTRKSSSSVNMNELD